MTEAIHTSEMMFGLNAGRGKGPKVWAGLVEASDAETLDTGLDVIDSITTGASGAPADEFIVAETVSGGTITFGTGQYTAAATPVADVAAYVTVIGRKY